MRAILGFCRMAAFSAVLATAGCSYHEYKETRETPPPPPPVEVAPALAPALGDHTYDLMGHDGRQYGTVQFRAIGVEGHVYDNSGHIIGDIVAPGQ
ncbi:MAG: hypothetical protein KGJ06_08405 [Pseudomonadota bacterium]|nr:hypothetical protein [Pseudomonadota bacterium]